MRVCVFTCTSCNEQSSYVFISTYCVYSGKISQLRCALLLCKYFAGLDFADACTSIVAPICKEYALNFQDLIFAVRH